MADGCKVWVEKQQVVLNIHQKLKNEISNIAKAKLWDNEKKKKFENSLLELYKDAVEESVKMSVSVNGKDWLDEPVQSQETTSCLEQAPILIENFSKSTVEPLNKERKNEVNNMWSILEDLLRETTKKRKEYPPLITDAVRNLLQYKVQTVENFNPIVKCDTLQPSSSTKITDDEECIQRLKSTINDLTELSKGFLEIQSKLDNLSKVLTTHKSMESSKVDAILFGKDSSGTPSQSRRSSRIPRTPNRYGSPLKPYQAKKRSITNCRTQNDLSSLYKKKK